MKPADAIADLIRAGLTESAIGDLVGASQSTVNRVRHGRVTPNYELGKALVDLAQRSGGRGQGTPQRQPEVRNG
jgi:hypothetical protein